MNVKSNQTRDGGQPRKVYLNVEIDLDLREDLHLTAREEGKSLKQWLPEFLRQHVPRKQIVSL